MGDTAAPPPAGAGAQNASSPARARIFLCVVDATEELQGALRFACRRAQHTGGRVALLYVMEPAEVGHWMAVEEKLREERREEAERTLNGFAAQAKEITGAMPVLYLREGEPADEIVKLVQEEPGISILVLGAGTGKKGPGPLVSSIAGKLSGKFPRPITIVPGNLTLEQIDEMT